MAWLVGFTRDFHCYFLINPISIFQSDNVAERDRRLRYISGFSGTNGVAVVTANKAALWTDGRYHVQADLELDCNWLLMGRGAVPVSYKFNMHSGWLFKSLLYSTKYSCIRCIIRA